MVEEGKVGVLRRLDFSRDPDGEIGGDAVTERKEGNVDNDSACKETVVVDMLR